jgi:hypothetical protein
VKERASDFSDLFAQEDPEGTFAQLRAEEYKKSAGPPLIHLHYLEGGPPIVIDAVSESEEVAGYVEEYLEEFFKGRQGQDAETVRKHLHETVEIVNFCLKQRHADGMGTPLTYAAAAWLAHIGEGLVRADEQDWMQLIDGHDLSIIAPE